MRSRLRRLGSGAIARLSAAAILAGGLSLTSPAQAGDAAAEALFLEGRKAAEKGDYETACAKFYESNRLEPAVGTMFNIGDCEEKRGKVATAWKSFREVVQRLPPGDDRAPIAQKRAAALERRLPKLSVKLAPGSPPGTRVVRGGIELGSASLGVALPVDPGIQTVEVTAEGRKPASFKVSLAEGEQRELEVRPGEPASVESPPPPVETSSRRTAGLVIGGVGVAGLVVGGVTGALTLGKKSTVDANCDADKRCNQQGFDAAQSGRTLGAVSAASFVIGALGAGVGAYLLLTDEGSGQARTALVPAVGPGSFQLGWVRAW